VSQAVVVICYELFLASRPKHTNFSPRLANIKELEAMYSHLQEALIKISFINHENPEHWMHNLRRFFSRLELRGRDIKIIRGICRQIDWYTREGYKKHIREKSE
jgi:tRNA/rRNA methyltransferase